MIKINSACFTGHRVISGDKALLANKLYSVIEQYIIEYGLTDFYSGGAVGWDELAARTILKLHEVYPQIRLHLILPCSKEEQTAAWTKEQKAAFFRILVLADTVEYTSEHYYDGCMKVRNARLVELADCCFSFWNSRRVRSGTAQTVRMAQKKKIMIVNFYQTN